jgi:hypothetical protein
VVRDQQQWQSAGRKDVIEAEALALKQYEKQLIEEARIKSDQFRVVSWSFVSLKTEGLNAQYTAHARCTLGCGSLFEI